MTIRYTSVANHMPENKMRLYPTKVINIIGGPGSDKSLYSSAIVLYLSLHHKTVEVIPDYAKSLVWQQNFEVLKNQYFIAQRQYDMINLLDGQIQFLITECSLPQNPGADSGVVQTTQQRQYSGGARQQEIPAYRALSG